MEENKNQEAELETIGGFAQLSQSRALGQKRPRTVTPKSEIFPSKNEEEKKVRKLLQIIREKLEQASKKKQEEE